ncbi:hypothetical protein ACE4RV_01050 [Acetobacter persici]|uniref:hypothetical protein n=1 Tax=Acetobacter TaxID=434 RepID=UPI0003842E88|nr:hypothetical protein [Acetobacter pasteurianus]CCT59732.1 hypothetical protein APA386B_1657 [Acetobacter pasteurianus 386B]
MPLNKTDRDNVIRYCDRDVPASALVEGYFDFVQDADLKSALVREYIAARYIYKLQEALNVSDEKLAAHAKFQIVQFAAIYEALIVHILWTHFAESPEVRAIEYYKTLRKVAQFPKNLEVNTKEGLEVHLCIEAEIRNTRHSIKFDDKIAAAVKIGFVDPSLGEEIKEFFKTRNGVHIENAVKNEIEYEISQSQLAYWRIKPFTTGIRDFLTTGKLTEAARPKQDQKENKE